MLFKSIELHNFGRYADTNQIMTTVNNNRNVILIKAKNDRGKTTLFRAIKFALYGDDGLNDDGAGEKTASEWVNLQRASEDDGQMYVEIKFKHEGKEYRLKRSVKFSRTDIGKSIPTGSHDVDIFENDKPIMTGDSESNKKDWIDTILPKDASQFFFFDGEEIQRYINKEETHVKQAIEKVLGIKELLNAKEDFINIQRIFQTDYKRNITKQNKDEKLQKELESIYEQLDGITQDIQNTDSFLNGARSRKIDVDKDLKKYKNINKIVDQRKDVEDTIYGLKKSLKDAEKTLKENHGNIGLILATPLLDIINKTEEDPPSIDRWLSDTIKFFTSNNLDKCICDRPINEQVRQVFAKKTLKITPSKTSILKKFANNMLINHAPATKSASLITALDAIATKTQEIDKQISTKEKLSQEIRGSEYSNLIQELENKYDDIVKDIGKYEQELDNFKARKGRLENQKSNFEATIKSSVVDKQLTDAEKRKDMCDTIMNCIDQSINRFYETRKPELESHISEIFRSLTNNPELYRGLKIDRDFSMWVIRNDDTEHRTYKYSLSAGASQIVATSMIGGLNKFATKDAPIIIDTPMGRLDPEHRKNLINYYSKMGKQIIILYQPSELSDADIQNINDHIASEWDIESAPNSPDISKINQKVSHL